MIVYIKSAEESTNNDQIDEKNDKITWKEKALYYIYENKDVTSEATHIKNSKRTFIK